MIEDWKSDDTGQVKNRAGVNKNKDYLVEKGLLLDLMARLGVFNGTCASVRLDAIRGWLRIASVDDILLKWNFNF